MRPMLATTGDHVPTGGEWQHEVKWDGVRILLEAGTGEPRLVSRNGNDVTAGWPDVAVPSPGERDLLLDGEVIALDEDGRPDFRVLQHRMHVRRRAEVARLADAVPATYMVFDLLRLDGRDLTDLPLEERRERLAGLDLGPTGWQVPVAYADGAMVWEATRQQGLEGVVSKRRGSPYRCGTRSRDWLKRAHRHRGSYVVGGWRPEQGSPQRLGAVLVGEPTPDGLRFRGRVGSGLAGTAARTLQERLTPLTVPGSPFADEVPLADADGTTWVEPVVVVDVDTHGRGGGRLRQPSFRGVRSDLDPDDLTAQHPSGTDA